MSEGLRWGDAEAVLRGLTPAARSVLGLAATLPFVSADQLAPLLGSGGGGDIYRVLGGLERAGLLASIEPSCQPGRSPRRFYPSDVGLAVLALARGESMEGLARRHRLDRSGLLARLPGLPQLVAAYDLLGALAAAGPGRPELVAWESPWRRRFQLPTTKGPSAIQLPASVALSWEDGTLRRYLLLPDLATAPARAWRPALGKLLVLRAREFYAAVREFPYLVIAAPTEGRLAAWRALLAEVATSRGEAPLAAWLTTWGGLPEGRSAIASREGTEPPSAPRQPPRSQEPINQTEADRLPCMVGPALGARQGRDSAGDRLGQLGLALSNTDRSLLDLIGRHPFLLVDQIAAILGWVPEWALRRRNALVRQGLLRLVGPEEAGEDLASLGAVELTADGLRITAAGEGLSVGGAVRLNGLAGGGPEHPFGSRQSLLRHVEHTVGVNALFASLFVTARQLGAEGCRDEVVEWQSAAACERRRVHPDGYGIYRHRGALYGFFLEYDRGTMRARDYVPKFDAYREYHDSARFAADYSGFPTILVVTRDEASEDRIARVALKVTAGGSPLPVLLTVQARVLGPRAHPAGMLGPVWRNLDAPPTERRPWPWT